LELEGPQENVNDVEKKNTKLMVW